jgi:hypothetical protein
MEELEKLKKATKLTKHPDMKLAYKHVYGCDFPESQTKTLIKESVTGMVRGGITGLLLSTPAAACANALTFAVVNPTLNKVIESMLDTSI